MRSVVCILFLFSLLPAITGAQSYSHRMYSLLPQGANALLPGSLALDTWRGECYIASSVYPHIAVVNIPKRRYDSVIILPGPKERRVSLLGVHPSNRLLYFAADLRLPGSLALRSYDIIRGQSGPSRALGACERLHLAVDTKRNTLYISTGRTSVLRLNASTLQLHDSIDFDVPVGGLAFDSSNGELYVAQRDAGFGVASIYRIAVETGEKLRTITFPASEAYDRVFFDASLHRAVALSRQHMKLFNEFDVPEFDYPVQWGAGDASQSELFNRLYISASKRIIHSPGEPFTGRMMIVGFEQHMADSIDQFSGPMLLAAHDASLSLAAVDCITSTLYISRLPDLFPLSVIQLGADVTSLAALGADGTIAVANTFGAHRELALCVQSAGIRRMETGSVPSGAACAGMPQRTAVLSQDEGAIYLHNSDGDIMRKLYLPGFESANTALLSSMTMHEEGSRVLCISPASAMLAVADITAGTIVSSGSIEHFPGVSGIGKGLVQGAFIGDGMQFAVLFLEQKTLQVYNSSDCSYQYTVDLSGLVWEQIAPFERCCLHTGRTNGEIFVGPYAVSLQGAEPLRRILPVHSVCLSFADERIWGMTISGDTVSVIALPIQGGPEEYRAQLSELSGIPGGLFMHPMYSRLIAGCNERAEVHDYRFYLPNEVRLPDIEQPLAVQAFPNPLHLPGAETLTVRISGTGSPVTVVLDDALGRRRAHRRIDRDTETISISREALPACGWYLLRVYDGERTVSTPLLVIE